MKLPHFIGTFGCFLICLLSACGQNQSPADRNRAVFQTVLGEWVIFADGIGRGDTGKLNLKKDGSFDAEVTVEKKTERWKGTFTVNDLTVGSDTYPCVTLISKDEKGTPTEKRLMFDQSGNILHDMLTIYYCRPNEIDKARKLIERPEQPKTAEKARMLNTKEVWSAKVEPHEIDHYGIASGDFLGNGKQQVIASHANGFSVFDSTGKLIRDFKGGDPRGGHIAMGRLKGQSLLIQFETWGRTIEAIDLQGKSIWKFSAKDSGIDWVAPVKLDEANTGYFIGYNGGGGVQFVNPDGTEKWFKPADWNVWNVASIGRGAKEPDVMVCVGSNENAIVYDTSGAEIRDIKMGDIGAVGGADLDNDGKDEILGLGTTVVSGQNVYVSDQDGKPRWSHPANASDSINLEKAFLIGNFGSAGRLLGVCEQGGILFFQPDGKVYGKILTNCIGACVLKRNGDPDLLVLHEGNRIVSLSLMSK